MGLFNRLVVACMPVVPRPIVRFVASRYVAGDTLDKAIACVRQLAQEGACATMDILGEAVTDPAKAQAYVQRYLELFDRLKAEALCQGADKLNQATVSLKPTMLGLCISEQEAAANIEAIVAAAQARGVHLTIDMEDHTTTGFTLRTYKDMLARHGNAGTVLQAYMRRTLADIDGLPPENCHLRLCKGIYIEPRAVAWKDYQTVRRNYLAALRKLLRRGAYVGIATHDEYLVHEAMALIDELGLKPDQYEFQMLLGVDPELRRIIIAGGHRLRIYVPYGPDWYPYSTRRLRENPAMAGHVIRAFFGMR